MNVAGLCQNNIYLAVIKYRDCKDKTIPKDVRKHFESSWKIKFLRFKKSDSRNLKNQTNPQKLKGESPL